MELSFAEQVRIILKRNNKSVEDLAKILGTTRQNLNQQLKRDNFRCEDMEKICKGLGCSLVIQIEEEEEGVERP